MGEFLVFVIILGLAIWLAVTFWYVSVPLVALGLLFYGWKRQKEERQKRERVAAASEAQRRVVERRIEAERQAEERRIEAKREAEELSHRQRQSAYQAKMIRLSDECMELFAGASGHIESAERYLDQAERDFSERVFAPFWVSVERALASLGAFDDEVRRIAKASSEFSELIKVYEAAPPAFPLAAASASKLAVGTDTAKRMQLIVRRAQSDFQFATIYVAGFASLGDALDQTTVRIVSTLCDVANAIDNVGSGPGDSLQAPDTGVAALQPASTEHFAVVAQRDEEQAERERQTVAILDDIKRRQEPGP